MVVASLLLHNEEEFYPMKELLADCQTLYQYFKVRGIDTFMNQPPNKKSIERVLAGLGFAIKSTQKSAQSKNLDQFVVMAKKKNQREALSLAYYSTAIVQHTVMDIVMSSVLLALGQKRTKLSLSELDEQAGLMSHIFRNEYNDRA